MLAAGLVVAGPAPAAEAAACSGSTGVTVVVDFGSLGGGVQTGCAGGNPGSGLAALSGAGHGYTFVPRQPGLVCQVDARPNPCNGAPTTAYWAYWHASRGGSWSYSTLGAGGYDPAPGTVEGWAFGAGRQPGIAPPAAPAPPRPAPKPTTKPAPRPTAQPPAAPGRAGMAAPGGGAPAPGPSAGGAPRGTGQGSRPGTADTSSAPDHHGTVHIGRSDRDGRHLGVSTGAAAAPSDSASPTRRAAAPRARGGHRPRRTPAHRSWWPRPARRLKTLGAFSLALALIAAVAVAGFLIARRRRAGPPI